MPQFFVSAVTAKVVRQELVEAQAMSATTYGLELPLVRAICKKESNDWPWALRYEPRLATKEWFREACRKHKIKLLDWHYSTSVGPMQILTINCYEHGFDEGWDALYGDMHVTLDYGCIHLSKLLKHYEGNVKDAVSAYNFGSATDKNYLDYTLPVLELYEKYKQEVS